MLKLLLPIVAVLAIGGSAAGASVYLLNRGETLEQAPPPAVQATATPTPALTAAPTPAPTPVPSPAPEGWTTYADSEGRFTLSYPPTWFEKGGSFYSRDPDTFKGAPDPPRQIVEVEIGYGSAVGSDTCGGTLSVDPKTGEALGPLPGAVQSSIGRIPAWKIVRVQGGDPPIQENLTRIERITAIYKGDCVFITAYFTQENPDETIFQDIADTFRFTD